MPSYQKLKMGGFLLLLCLMAIGLVHCSATSDQEFEPLRAEKFAPRDSPPPPLPAPPNLDIPENAKLAKRNLEHGQELFKAGKYPEAQFFIRKSLFKAPGNATAVKLLPWAYFYEKKFDKALTAFINARALLKRDPEPVIGVAWSYLAMQFYEKAFETFDAAVKLSANPENAILGKGVANLLMERYGPAKVELRKIYLPAEVDQLTKFWDQWQDKNPGMPMAIIPSGLFSPSLFTLPIDRPRYESMLFGLVPIAHPKIPGQLWTPPGIFSGQQNNAVGRPSSPLGQAWDYFRTGEYKNSLTAFKDLPKRDRASIDGMNGLGWSYLHMDHLHRAGQVFKKIIATWPTFAGAKEGLAKVNEALMEKAAQGQFFYESKSYEDAQKIFAKLRQDYSEWSHPDSMLGMIHLEQNHFDKAGKSFLLALKLDPEDKTALDGMKRLHSIFVPKLIDADNALDNKDYKRAAKLYWGYISSLGASADLTPTLEKAYSGLGWSQMGKRHYQQAIEKFQKIQEVERYREDSIKGMGLANFHLGNYSQAEEFLSETYEQDPDQSEIYYPLYFSLMKTADPLEAEDYLLEENRKFPRRASIYLVLGWLYHTNQKPDLGVEYFMKSISLDPEIALTPKFKKMLDGERFGWQVINHFGWAYYHRKRHDTSLTLFNWALQSHPKSSVAMAGKGYNLFKLGRLSEAETYLRMSLKRNPYPVAIKEMVNQKNSTTMLEITTSPRIILGRILILKGKHEEALAQFSKEDAQKPGQAQAIDGKGWSYLHLNRLAEARVAFNEAIRLQPTNHLSHKGLREVKRQIAAEKLPRLTTIPAIMGFTDEFPPVKNLGVFGE